MAELLEWLSVVGVASLKVIPGLALAIAHQMSPLEIFLALTIGSSLGVLIFTLFGLRIRRWRKERRKRKGIRKPLNFRKARKWKRLWSRYGLPGVALLTPPMLSPPIGTLIAVLFERRKGRILIFMGASILLWCTIFALLGKGALEAIH
jgi:hypothetical protein